MKLETHLSVILAKWTGLMPLLGGVQFRDHSSAEGVGTEPCPDVVPGCGVALL